MPSEGLERKHEAGAGDTGEDNAYLRAKHHMSGDLLDIRTVPIDQIKVDGNRRKLGDLTPLMKSIGTVGLLSPILVTSDNHLVAGRHRLEACRRLDWAEIPAVVVELDVLQAELATIDENLVRNDLTVLEHSDQLTRRKEIYEELNPDARRPQGGRRARNDEIISPFSEDTAAKVGVTARTVQQEIQIGSKIAAEVKDAIRDTEIADNKTALLRIARTDPSKQLEVAQCLIEDKRWAVAQDKPNKKKASQIETKLPTIQQGQPMVTTFNELPLVTGGSFNAVVFDFSLLNDGLSKLQEHCAHNDCVAWLWTGNTTMQGALEAIVQCGFTIKTIITWVKGAEKNADGLFEGTEHCIVAVRGTPEFKLAEHGMALVAPARDGAAKPEEFYELVEMICPGSKSDLSVPIQRHGWGIDSSGECESAILRDIAEGKDVELNPSTGRND